MTAGGIPSLSLTIYTVLLCRQSKDVPWFRSTLVYPQDGSKDPPKFWLQEIDVWNNEIAPASLYMEGDPQIIVLNPNIIRIFSFCSLIR